MASNLTFGRDVAVVPNGNAPCKSADELVCSTAAMKVMPTEEEKGSSDFRRCQFNNYQYDCGCIDAGPGPRVKHVNCTGVPSGQVRCQNMSVRPSYPKIESKCRNCIRDDVLMKEAMVGNATRANASLYGRPTDDMSDSFVNLDVKDTLVYPSVPKNRNVSGEVGPRTSNFRPNPSFPQRSHPYRRQNNPSHATADMPAVNQKIDKLHNAKLAHKLHLLSEETLIGTRLERVRLQMIDAEARDNAKAFKLLERKMAEMQKQNETLGIKLALLEKPAIAWQSQGEIIEASGKARAVMKDQAEMEAISSVPLLEDPLKLAAYTKTFVSGDSKNTHTTRSGLVVKEIVEEGWDMVDEFEDEDWVEIPGKRFSNE